MSKNFYSSCVSCIFKLSQIYMFNVQRDKTGHLLDYNITMELNGIALNQQASTTISICFTILRRRQLFLLPKILSIMVKRQMFLNSHICTGFQFVELFVCKIYSTFLYIYLLILYIKCNTSYIFVYNICGQQNNDIMMFKTRCLQSYPA